MTEVILETKELKKAFGGLMALSDLTFQVKAGQIKAIIGPNGAGKTTLFNAITGMLPTTAGYITFKGKVISRSSTHEIASMGISRTFQTVELFKNMTVLENVMVGRHCRTRCGLLRVGFRLRGVRFEEEKIYQEAIKRLAFVGLERKASESAATHARIIIYLGHCCPRTN